MEVKCECVMLSVKVKMLKYLESSSPLKQTHTTENRTEYFNIITLTLNITHSHFTSTIHGRTSQKQA
jgi:hypothetical protein